jgi:outer membrane protein insertion porin family
VHILPVKPYLGPHQNLCSPQDSSPVKKGAPDEQLRGALIMHHAISRKPRFSSLLFRLTAILLLVLSGSIAFAQNQVIQSIRVIGNRRIPKETIKARMFSHEGEAYDPISIERDFNSLWNTGYFEDLRIEREDTEKGVVLDVFVRERPTIREINYKGNSSVSNSDILDRFKKEKVGLSVEGQ